MLLRAHYLTKALEEVENAKQVVNSIAPKSEFVFLAVDEQHIYFKVVAKPSQIDKQQKLDLAEKTRFIVEEVNDSAAIYLAHFKMIVHASNN
jgi:hypothetical protein